MPRRKPSTLAITKYVMALVVVSTVIYTQVLQIELGREFWNLVSFIFTAVFGGFVHYVLQRAGQSKATMSEIGQSILGLAVVGLVCYLTSARKDVAKSLWQIATVVITFVFIGRSGGESTGA